VAARPGGAAAVLLLGVTILLWGTSFPAVDVAGDHASALVVTAVRLVVAGLFLLVVLRLSGAAPPGGTMLRWAVVTGILMFALPLETTAEAILRAGVGNAAVLSNTSPFFVLVLGRIFLGERISRLGVGGLVVGFAGVVLMVSSQLGGPAGTSDLAVGMALAVAAAAGWGVGTLLVKRLVERDPAFDLVALTGWPALRRVAATRAAAWQFLVPVVAVAVDLARGESPEPVVLAGMVLAIAGVALVNVAPARVIPPSPALPRT
jgi:drug/metabolite transporter (DMT)-like permease